ncbi:MAG: hypothetical protein COB67_05895 [SAR324 cluster bacterium]|uniref:GIY-YIG domain-containing protein n=1 Tax=SAR324 cluster bacterium TaxID=2024889 RepID=A0A2A4T556_9DELT|nr:MAG: hypothetical protein COB67_05895 [SAR324 cluster bacterium]
MTYSNIQDLKLFLASCENELLFNDKNRKKLNYPINKTNDWLPDDIKKLNKSLLKEIAKKTNVYAIFIANKNSNDYKAVYIGQSKSSGARTRLTNHLIKKHKKTGAKLDQVIRHIEDGGSIKVSFILTEPESLRHYIEEELIKKYSKTLIWNIHSK